MREIKVRGYSTEKLCADSQWVEGFGVMDVKYTNGEVEYYIMSNGGKFEVFEKSIGQYTGLRDINGDEIFEGHIVKYSFKDGDSVNTRVMEVFNDGLVFRLREIYRDYWLETVEGIMSLKHGHLIKYRGEIQQMFKSFSGIYFYEVIGNVFEHPHLLEVAE